MHSYNPATHTACRSIFSQWDEKSQHTTPNCHSRVRGNPVSFSFALPCVRIGLKQKTPGFPIKNVGNDKLVNEATQEKDQKQVAGFFVYAFQVGPEIRVAPVYPNDRNGNRKIR